MKAEPFQNVKNQIGFCGIWCGSCVGGNGAIVELARRFDKTLKNYKLKKWVPRNFDFQEFMKGLHPYKPCIYARDAEKAAVHQLAELESAPRRRTWLTATNATSLQTAKI